MSEGTLVFFLVRFGDFLGFFWCELVTSSSFTAMVFQARRSGVLAGGTSGSSVFWQLRRCKLKSYLDSYWRASSLGCQKGR